jgi:hypothetical protein
MGKKLRSWAYQAFQPLALLTLAATQTPLNLTSLRTRAEDYCRGTLSDMYLRKNEENPPPDTATLLGLRLAFYSEEFTVTPCEPLKTGLQGFCTP